MQQHSVRLHASAIHAQQPTAILPLPIMLQELAKLTGSVLGSQLMPVYHPDPRHAGNRPKLMLLVMCAMMLLMLVPCALARQFMGNAPTMLALLLISYSFGG